MLWQMFKIARRYKCQTYMIKELELIKDFRRLNLEIYVSSTYISYNMFVIPNEFLKKSEREAIGGFELKNI